MAIVNSPGYNSLHPGAKIFQKLGFYPGDSIDLRTQHRRLRDQGIIIVRIRDGSHPVSQWATNSTVAP